MFPRAIKCNSSQLFLRKFKLAMVTYKKVYSFKFVVKIMSALGNMLAHRERSLIGMVDMLPMNSHSHLEKVAHLTYNYIFVEIIVDFVHFWLDFVTMSFNNLSF